MVDTKKLKEVSAQFSATAAASPASFPAPVAAGAPQVLTVSTVGVQFVTFASEDGTVTLSVVADNSPAPATPTGLFIEGIFRSSLPTYTDGDAVVPHFDSRGRLLVSPGEGSITADVDTDQAAAPATPIGQYIIGKHEATLPTYGADTNSTFHFDERGRQIVVLNTDTGTTSSVPASATNVTLLAANIGRAGATIHNDSASATLHVKLGATATLTDYTTKIAPDGYYEVPFGYAGIIDGIWTAAVGDARITELT